MKTKIVLLTGSVIVTVVLVAGAIHLTNRPQGEPPRPPGTGDSSPVLTVDALASKAANQIGKPFALHGVVDRVSAEQRLVILIDPSEANCTDACTRNIVIVAMPTGSDSPLPALRSEVLAHGAVESAGLPLRMTASMIETDAATIRKTLGEEVQR